jgi:hypothetical protein
MLRRQLGHRRRRRAESMQLGDEVRVEHEAGHHRPARGGRATGSAG